jgi:aspartate kinase
MVARSAGGDHVSFERERGVYRIDVTRDVAHAVVKVGGEADRSDRILRAFRVLSDAQVPIFLIKLHRTAVSFGMAGIDVPALERALDEAGFPYTARRDLAIVSVVATSMRDLTGVMVSIADALQEVGARLYGTGDSHNSVQCLIEASRLEPAIEQLKLNFGLEEWRA